MPVDESAFRGTIEEEAKVLRACMAALARPGLRHSVASLTTLGHPIFDLLSGGHKYRGFDHTWLTQYLRGARRDTYDDFKAKNAKHYPVAPLLAEDARLRVVPNEDLRRIFVEEGGGWDEFGRRYPHVRSLVALSRVGFDAKMTQAIAQIGITIGGESGNGSLCLCVRTEQVWAVADQFSVWMH